jgi:uncharacterized protein DUF1707
VDSDGGMRASDSDRERVVDILRGAYTEGRLTLDEFDERTTAAYAARTWSQLRELTGDLPVQANLRRPPGSTVGAPGRDRGAAQPLPGAPPPVPAGRPGFFPVLPFVILFIVLAGSVHTAALAVLPAIVVLMVWLRVSGRHHHDHRPPGPPGPGGGRA